MLAEPRNLNSARPLAAAAGLTTASAVLAFALLTALAAQVRLPLPFTPVPFTFQVLTVLLAGYALGAFPALASMLLYLGLGAAGLPVFGGGATAAALAGPTAGYLLAFPLAALAVSRIAAGSTSLSRRLVAGLVGLAVIHAGGLLWLAWLLPTAPGGTGALLTWSVLPFLGTDLVKLLAAERLARLLVPRRL
jgi:biotin transport system substrate-specific component